MFTSTPKKRRKASKQPVAGGATTYKNRLGWSFQNAARQGVLCYVTDMDPTIAYLWSRHEPSADDAADWAISLLENGHDSDAVRRLTDRHLPRKDQERLAAVVLRELNLAPLLDPRVLAREYERANIEDYLHGRMDGQTLIQRCCDIRWDQHDGQRHRFWMALADDSCQHDGLGFCIDFDFINQDFDTALRSALSGKLAD